MRNMRTFGHVNFQQIQEVVKVMVIEITGQEKVCEGCAFVKEKDKAVKHLQ